MDLNLSKIKNKITLALVNAFVIIGLAGALIKFLDLFSENPMDFRFSVSLIALLLGSQLLLLLVSAWTWRLFIMVFSRQEMPFIGGVEQISFMLLSKYIPGKFWGLAVRAMTSHRYGIAATTTMNVSIFEQLVVLYISGFIGFSLYASIFDVRLSIMLLCLTLILSYPLIGFALKVTGKIVSHWKWRWLDAFKHTERFNSVTPYQLMGVSLATCSQWLVICCPIYVFSVALSIAPVDVLPLLGAYMIATGVGFLALFAPGGIGVREGLFVLLALELIPSGPALQLALLMRLWSTAYDIFAATSGSVIYFLGASINVEPKS